MPSIRQFRIASIAGLCLLAGTVDAKGRGSPQLGVYGRFETGYGLVVERVRWGSPAGRIGLEPGDVIRAIDGRWLRTEADYRRQLRRTEVSAHLIIRDVRTGKLLRRPVQVR